MNRFESRTRSALLLVVIMSVALSATIASADTVTPKKRLSLSTITLFGGQTSSGYASFFTAQARGYYKHAGLNVNLIQTTASAADEGAALISGSYNLIETNPQALMIATQGGAPVRLLMASGYGTADEIAISTSVAAADNIPATGLAAQTRALKGTHLTIGISNSASASYLNTVLYLENNGLTVSLATSPLNPSADVSFQTLGSPTTLTTALAAGKIQAIANNPPVTVLPNSVVMTVGKGTPLTKEPAWALMATTTFISQHPDTVQAFVTATVQGWAYSRNHLAAVVKYSTPYFSAALITSPEEIQYLVGDQLASTGSTTPAVTKTGFKILTQCIDAGSPTKITSPMSTFVDNVFVNKAIKQLGLKVPLG